MLSLESFLSSDYRQALILFRGDKVWCDSLTWLKRPYTFFVGLG